MIHLLVLTSVVVSVGGFFFPKAAFTTDTSVESSTDFAVAESDILEALKAFRRDQLRVEDV